MNSRLLTITVVIMVLICAGIGVLIFRPSDVIQSSQAAVIPETNIHENTLSVAGVGRYKIKPDIAYLTIGVSTQNPNAKTAQSENKKLMEQVVKAIKVIGLKDEDIQTSRFNIDAQYDYSNNKPVLTGYNVTNMVALKVRDINKVGDVIDEATNAGANQAYDIRFGLEDAESAYKRALEDAIKVAKGKADIMAKASNLQLKGPVMISEGERSVIEDRRYFSGSAMKLEAAADGGTPISAGELEVNASVTIIYSIK